MINKNIKITQDGEFTEADLLQAPDGFFTEIKAIDILENSKNKDILNIICNKVRKKGKVILYGIDGLELCRQVYSGSISLEDASEKFFGPSKSLNSIVTLKKYFLEKKWNLLFAGVQNGRYLIEVVRV